MFQSILLVCFNTQPPEGGWVNPFEDWYKSTSVSTHSRLKAAGFVNCRLRPQHLVSTHSRLKAAGCTAGRSPVSSPGFNTQPPEGGWLHCLTFPACSSGFQHTAA